MGKQSKTLSAFTAALAAAQAAFPTIAKSKTGWTTDTGADGREAPKQYAYADIADLLNACRPVVAAQGITITQLPRIADGMMMLDTRLQLGEEWIEAEYPVCVITAHPREIGAALTYARRYALAPMLGVAAEEDMDGAGAAKIDPLGLNIEQPSSSASSGPPPAPREEVTTDEPDTESAPVDGGYSAVREAQTEATAEHFADPEEVLQRAEEELSLMDTLADYDEAWAPFMRHQATMFPMDWDRLVQIAARHRDRIEQANRPSSSGRPGMNRGQS